MTIPGLAARWLLLGGAGLLACLVAGAGASSQEHHHPSGPGDVVSGYADMGPHMRVTVKRPPRDGDVGRTDGIVKETRRVIERYKDHRLAIQDGYKPFLAHLPLPEYHFTNYWYGFQAGFRFDVERPTSLLYVREADGYRLTGAMFTAGAGVSLEELDRRLPLSVAQWHLHTAVCMPPKGQGADMFGRNPRFGLAGNLSTLEACEKAGGRFFPHLFGWMVHVYPYEERAEDIFRLPGHHGHGQEHPAGHRESGGHKH